MNILKTLDVFITNLLNSLGILGPLFGCLLIMVESMIPILPLSVFITLNFYTFGNILGFIISYIFTVIGCIISFSIFRSKLKNKFDKFLNKKDHKQMKRIIKVFNKIKLENLVIFIALPFTPAFLINIAAGLSNMNKRKFLLAICIGKLFLVYFWGYIGITLIDSLTHPEYLIRICIIILVAYFFSKLINKKTGVD